MTVHRLRPGDRVRYVSPASTPSEQGVERGVRQLERWGLQVETGCHAFDSHGYLAGTDDDRLSDLHDAFNDPGVRAVLATRGDKGAYRIAARLDFDALRADPKPLIGFSDITYLHLTLLNAGIPGALHGPTTGWTEDDDGALCAKHLRRALMDADPITVHSNPAAYTAHFTTGRPVTGRLIGGNLDSISRSVGWAMPSLAGAILLLEDHRGTGLGQIDRCLAQLTHSGALDHLAGIALGDFGDFQTTRTAGWALEDVLTGWLDALDVPVLGGLPIGHCPNPATVPLGTSTTINPATGSMTCAPAVL